VGGLLGWTEGESEVGEIEGWSVDGDRVGFSEGLTEGTTDGENEGETEGRFEGE